MGQDLLINKENIIWINYKKLQIVLRLKLTTY